MSQDKRREARMEGKQAMDIENIADLIEYVYTGKKGGSDEKSEGEDISLSPSVKEYKKLKRIMKIMVRFYEKGADMKKKQVEQVNEDLIKLENDKKMIKEQLEVLDQFPPFHPKRREYEEGLERELEGLEAQEKQLLEQREPFKLLADWSLQIVKTVEWLEDNIYRYCKDFLNLDVELDDKIRARLNTKLTIPQYKIFRRGLDEITFNLQESQDFFDASLDGRLKQYQQLEKCMIDAQLKIIRKYDDDKSGRKKFAEEELQRDLDYIKSHMEEDPKITKHRENMKQIHRDFFAVLKWQRERLLDMILEGEAAKASVRDFIEGTDEEIEALREEYRKEAEKKKQEEAAGGPKTDGETTAAAPAVEMKCPITTMPKNHNDLKIKNLYDEKCPVSKST
eukprot:TRINITY_DN14813_c0_g1_i1.p1 TRINITY_DN14813_c0_g1~~TRINITY_DN14813_c0_g1_i1.p1  ORF type:complete len:440 (+),score=155.51 TRINITY_DN14813_c0_g1_i1:137-1321(+)